MTELPAMHAADPARFPRPSAMPPVGGAPAAGAGARVAVVGGIAVVALWGELDAVAAPAVLAAFDAQLAHGRIRLVGDLTDADYASSSGLRALLASARGSRRRGGDCRLAAPRPDLLRTLDMAGLTSILRVFDDVEQAVASYRA